MLYNTHDKCKVGFLNLLIVKWLIRQTKTSIKPRQKVSKHKLQGEISLLYVHQQKTSCGIRT